MGTVGVIFSRRHAVGSVLIRTFLWSPWSHCGIIDDDTDEVIEAVMSEGVIARPVQAFKDAASKWDVVRIPCADPAAVIRAARSRIGTPYDHLGVLAMLLRIRMQSPANDFCAEHVVWSFLTGGTPLFRVDASRITPRDLYIRHY